MGTVSTFTFTSSTETVTQTKLNNLVANLLTEFNGSIDADNLAAGAVTAAKLATSAVDLTSNKVTGVLPGANQTTTVGTVTASEGVAVDANKDIGDFRNFTMTGTFTNGATQLSATELGYLDSLTAGTASASKALVVDASKDIDLDTGDLSCTNLTFTGTFNTDISTDEVSYLNGVTSAIQTQIDAKKTATDVVGKSAVGTYTGTGSSVNVEFGFQPKIVNIYATQNGSWFVDTASSGTTSYWHGPNGAAGATYTVTIDAQGFNTTGANSHVNTRVYYYHAIG